MNISNQKRKFSPNKLKIHLYLGAQIIRTSTLIWYLRLKFSNTYACLKVIRIESILLKFAGSALLALQGDQGPFGEPAIHRLIEALDTHVKGCLI